MHQQDGIDVNFSWNRNRLFDRASVIILYERCLDARTVRVSKVTTKPTKKWKPLPLTTVELQKNATRFLRMNSQTAMKIAEDLYTKGFISYPRTETDRFDRGMNLRALVGNQTQDNQWGAFAQGLMNGGFQQPREGRNDDKAHPPIHPVIYTPPRSLNDEQRRVYEFVVRRFLACCSEDAKGTATDVEITYGDEKFHAHGLVVLERNYLDVYVYDKWTSSQILPNFTIGEQFEPTEAMMTEGKTVAPGYLTEPDLIALMDANGIGTDATMAEHIAKIKEREYVMTQTRGGGRATQNDADDDDDNPPARGGRGGRGARGSRGSRGNRGGRGDRGGGNEAATNGRPQGNPMEEFIPTTLGVALVAGYDRIGHDTSLSKPFLRKEMELKMKEICAGRKSKQDVVRESVDQYRQVWMRTQNNIGILKDVSHVALL